MAYISPKVYNIPFYYTTGKTPTEADIVAFIGTKKVQNTVLDTLEEYYLGQQDVLLRAQASTTAPCNRIVSNYCQIVVDFYNNYLLGKPIQYKAEDEALRGLINEIFEYNDAHDVDVENNQKANIMGASAEQLYLDSDSKLRFTNVDYRNVIFVYNKDVEMELNSAIKFYKYDNADPEYTVEVWTPTGVNIYKLDEAFAHLRPVEGSRPHSFKGVPFVEYINNNYRVGSFNGILTLQDAYNILCSLEIDDYQSFVDAFLAIYNASGTTEDDIAAMKVNRVLLLDGESKAEWIVKNCNPAQIEQIKANIIKDIHKITNLPDLSDQNFAGNASGTAIKYKLVGAENVVSKQERKFKRGLQKRLFLIVDYLNLVNNKNYNYLDIGIVFNRAMVGADLELAQMIQFLKDSPIPIKPLAAQLSFMSEPYLAFIPENATNASVVTTSGMV